MNDQLKVKVFSYKCQTHSCWRTEVQNLFTWLALVSWVYIKTHVQVSRAQTCNPVDHAHRELAGVLANDFCCLFSHPQLSFLLFLFLFSRTCILWAQIKVRFSPPSRSGTRTIPTTCTYLTREAYTSPWPWRTSGPAVGSEATAWSTFTRHNFIPNLLTSLH